MPEFKVGDRVICVEDNPYGNDDIFAGNTGTVCRKTIMEMSGFAGTIRSKVGITAMAPANMDSVGTLARVQ